MSDRVDFNISNNGISVGASVTLDYFEARVLPLITILLADMDPALKRRPASRRAARPEPKPRRAGTTKPAIPLPASSAPAATRAAAINSYSPKPSAQKSGTHILA